MPDDVSAGNSKAILAGAGCCSATNKLKPAQRPRSLFKLSAGAKYNVQLTQMVEQVLNVISTAIYYIANKGLGEEKTHNKSENFIPSKWEVKLSIFKIV